MVTNVPTAASTDGVLVDHLPLGGSGPRLLFAHATGFCSTVWRPMAEVVGTAFECHALDFRGHGHSTRPTSGDFDWHGTAADVLAVLDAVDGSGDSPSGRREWYGVGHSMGGAALVLAEQARPGTFAALWLFEPIIFPGPPPAGADDPGNHLAEGAARRRASFPSVAAARANYASKPPMNAFDPRALDGYVERGLVLGPDPDPDAGPDAAELAFLSCAPADESQVYRMGPMHSAWGRLGEVITPTTVVRGSAEVPGPATIAPLVAERLDAGRLEDHPDLGHFGPLEAPDAMAASVLAAFGQP